MSEMSDSKSNAKETGISLTGASRYREANFNNWAKKAFWLPEEIAALSLGKDPSSLNEFSVGEVALSNIGLEFLDISEIARRAVIAEQIPEKCPPDIAIQWMKKFDLKIPKPLEDKVGQFYPSFDWKAALYHFHDRTLEGLDGILNELNLGRDPEVFVGPEIFKNLCNQIVQKIRECENSNLDDSNLISSDMSLNAKAANDNTGPDDNTKVYQSRDKLLVGMFISKYGYDLSAKKQKAFVNVVDDLQRCGIPLTYETSKRHLLEAIDRVSPPLLEDD